MSISERRNAVLKSNISIKSIGSGILNLAKGLKSATGISQNISTQQKKKGDFIRSSTRKDDNFFSRRRENIKRKEREDEIEASDTTQGTVKQQGSTLRRSARGFLGRLLDIVGVVIIGWFTTKLLPILPKLVFLVKLMVGLLEVGRFFTDTIATFIVNIEEGITQAFTQQKKNDLRKQTEDTQKELETAGKGIQGLFADFSLFTNEVRFTAQNLVSGTDVFDESGIQVGPTNKKENEEEKPPTEKENEDKEKAQKNLNKTGTSVRIRGGGVQGRKDSAEENLEKQAELKRRRQKEQESQNNNEQSKVDNEIDKQLEDVGDGLKKADNKLVRFAKNIFGVDIKNSVEQKPDDTLKSTSTKLDEKNFKTSMDDALTKFMKEEDDDLELEPEEGFANIEGMFDPVGTSNTKTIVTRESIKSKMGVSGRFDMNTGKAYINDIEVSLEEYSNFANMSDKERVRKYGRGEFDSNISVSSNPNDFSSLRLDDNKADGIKVDRKKEKILIVEKPVEMGSDGGGVNTMQGDSSIIFPTNNKNEMKKIQSVLLNA